MSNDETTKATGDEPMFKIEIEISEERIAYLLCCAWEGSMTGQWAGEATGGETGWPYTTKGPMRLLLDEPIVIEVQADRGDKRNGTKYVLDRAAVARGLSLLLSPESKLPSRHAAALLNDDCDAETGDVFLQLCLFGEVVYG